LIAEAFRAQLSVIKEEQGHEEMARAFMAIAQEESDCGSAKKGGDLGLFERGECMNELIYQCIIIH
jgi:parvulin-like peptidyl-prolyl isomerase